MSYQSTPMTPKTNTMATTSVITAIIGWLLTVITICIGPITGGVCAVPLSCITPIGWLAAVITGHMAKNQIKVTGEAGDGQATAGLVMGYIGLGLTVLSICILLILIVLTATGLFTLPILEEIMQQ